MLATLALLAAAAPNVVLVTIDTLRADRVGAYGHAAAATPNLDRLAREGVRVEEAVVQVPQTRPSHASIFTGRHPYEHAIRDNNSAPLDGRFPTLAAVLRERGYDTAAVVGAYPVARGSGLERGFDAFDDPFGTGAQATAHDPRSERDAAAVADVALRWLDQPRRPGRPFFLWLHFFDPHAPYEPPEPFAGRFARDPYDGEVAYVDAQLGRVLAKLNAAGLSDDTLVVVTSDHGEGLGDHGEDEHMVFVYDATLRVPLLARWPGRLRGGTRVTGQFRSVDLLPTVLELIGVPAPASSGASRADAWRAGGRIPDNESYAESLFGSLHFGWAPLRALRAEGWKFIAAPRPELYRLSEDAAESRNRMGDRAGVAEAMRARLATYDHATPRPGSPPGAAAMDPQAAERLAALGYVGGAFFSGTPSGADPKDRIEQFESQRRDFLAALKLYRKRDVEGAIRILQRLSAPARGTREPGRTERSFNVEYYLGRSLLDARRYEEAATHLERAAALSPASVPAYIFLAQAHAGARQGAQALKAVERGLSVAPANAELHQARGALLLRAGRLPEAQTALERARSLDAGNALVRVELATLYRNQGDLERARAEANEAMRLDPKSADARVASGLVLGAEGREQDAAGRFREALEIDADHADALFYLGSVLLRAGRGRDALRPLERLVSRNPAYPQAAATLELARRSLAPEPPGALALRLMRLGDRSTAEQVSRRLAAGEEFAALARAHSLDASAPRGGDLGRVRLDDLAEPLRSAAAALAPGQTSAPIETADGYVLLKRDQ